jgi:hypothetical protein
MALTKITKIKWLTIEDWAGHGAFDSDREIKIHSYSSLNRDIREEENKKREQLNVLSAPKGTNMPEELQNALDNMKIL